MPYFFAIDLHSVVIDIADGNISFDARNSHGLELKIRHRPCSVLRESLIDFNAKLPIYSRITLDEMGGKDFLCNVHRLCFHNRNFLTFYGINFSRLFL